MAHVVAPAVLALAVGGLSVVAEDAIALPGPPAPVVEQPRRFGHFLGDVLTQRLLLDSPALLPQLPPADRVGSWFERRASHIETDRDGRRWLAVEYQIVNAPDALSDVALPGVSIAVQSGPPLRIPEWRISLGPLTPAVAGAASDPRTLRPDRKPPPVRTRAMLQRLYAWSGALTATLGLWAIWFVWRNWRDAEVKPFARALQQLRRLDANDDGGWVVMHRALNAMAGRVVQPGSLPALLEARPSLAAVRPDLEDFYRQSSARFFALTPPTAQPSLIALCRKLRRIEKQGGA
jgi:mxaA protein